MDWGSLIGAGGAVLGGALGGGLLGGGNSNHTSRWYRENVRDLYGQAQDVANQPFEYYTDPRFADFSADQTAAMDMVRSNLGLGAGAVNQAISGAQGAMGYQPSQVTSGSVSGAYSPMGLSADQVSANYNPAQVQAQMLSGSYNYNPSMVGAGNVSAGSIKEERIGSKNFTDYDINQYMNPFISGVIDTSLSDIERARQETENAQKADMLAAGAWGGSRSGVAQSLTNREFANTAASTASQLRARGFDTAANLIGQDANRLLTADQSNQAANLAAKQSNQATSLAASQANASLALQAALANQAAGMNNAQFGANFGLQQGLANQGADLQSQLANLQSSQFGSQLGLNASLANQDANLRAGALNMQDNQFGANFGQQAAMYNNDAAMRAAIANQGAGLTANSQQLAGAALLGNLGMQQQQMGAMDAQNLMNIGNMQQAQAQMPMDFAYQQFLMDQGWDQNQMNFLRGFLTDPRGMAQGGMSQPNQGLGILGGALTGANLANSIYGAWQNANPTYSNGYSGINVNNYPVPNAPIPQDLSWIGQYGIGAQGGGALPPGMSWPTGGG